MLLLCMKIFAFILVRSAQLLNIEYSKFLYFYKFYVIVVQIIS